METFDYASAAMAAHRVITGEANTSDVEVAADFMARNEYVRQAECIPMMTNETFGAVRGALLMHALDADTDAGEYAGVGTTDGRVIRSEDVHVYRVNTAGEREYVRTDKGGKSASRANGRKSKNGGRPRSTNPSPAALAKREQRARKAAAITVQTARAVLPNLSVEAAAE